MSASVMLVFLENEKPKTKNVKIRALPGISRTWD
jgi:hypothetical protein